ncbi:MAG: NAD(P)-dependent oxidoreductase [Acidimicrobiia bacterium]|nr:NAD(P)-dependent oxidoreductase [Acidimicrobiia bacterium]
MGRDWTSDQAPRAGALALWEADTHWQGVHRPPCLWRAHPARASRQAHASSRDARAATCFQRNPKERQPGGRTVKKVVVTGAKGNTGVSIVKILRQSGYHVVGIDVKPADFWEQDYHVADLEDGASLHDICSGAFAIVHFGSFPTDSQTSWEKAYRNLALGGFHVLQAAANLGIRRVVMASSPEIYGLPGSLKYLPIDEDHPQRPRSIYGAVKQTLEALAQNYARWHGMTVASLRTLRIVYEGSYEWRFRRFTVSDEAAAPDLWAYVDARDVATACKAALEAEIEGHEAFVIAASDVCVETPTRQLLQRFYPAMEEIRAELAGQAGLYSTAKAERLLKWKPQHHWKSMAAESEQNKRS